MTGTECGVILPVGPEGIHDGTLDLAADEAVRRGTGVELLHVTHTWVTVPTRVDQMQSLDASLTAVGRTALTDVAARLRARLDGRVPVNTEIRSGAAAATIADRAAVGDLVVLERRDVGTVERLLTMSVSTRVAAHARVPVIVVPESWRPNPNEALPVVVGVDSPTDPITQVETAQQYALDTGRRLTVLHAAWVAEPFEDTVFVNYTRKEWADDADRELKIALAKLPDAPVELTRDVVWRRPVDALVGATRQAAVLVLNRRENHAHASQLGATTRAVLRHAEGPVMIVDRT